MSLITDLKRAFAYGAQDTLHAATEDWHSVKHGAAIAADVAVEAAQGIGDALEGLVNFPATALQQVISGNQTLSDNSITRAAAVGNQMIFFLPNLAAGEWLHNGAKAVGIETYTPFFTSVPRDVRGVVCALSSAGMIFAIPAAKAKGYAALGIPEKAVPVAETPLVRQLAAAVQQRAEAALQKVLAADDAVFAQAWKHTAPAGQMGALEIPQWILPTLTKVDLLRMFRQSTVSATDLQSLAQHADANVAGAARQAFYERTVPKGYVSIPGGEHRGQTLPSFAMKAKPVTNEEWQQSVDGKPQYVLLAEDSKTLAIRVEDVTAQPPSFVNPKINLNVGQVAIQGGQVLVKLVDTPSVAYDAQGRVFSRKNQPVVGVTYYHAQAWVLTDASGRLMLPTDLQQEAVASNFGSQRYGTATGDLYAGRCKLGHFDEYNNGIGVTADVNTSRYLPGPFGIYSQFNVWRWMQADPSKAYPYGLRGASWRSNYPGDMRAVFRSFSNPINHNVGVGLSPVVLLGFK